MSEAHVLYTCREQSRRLSDVEEGFEEDLPAMGDLEGRLDDLMPRVPEEDDTSEHGRTFPASAGELWHRDTVPLSKTRHVCKIFSPAALPWT